MEVRQLFDKGEGGATRKTRTTWMTDYATVWKEFLDGAFPFGEGATVLRDLEGIHSKEKILDHLRVYLTKTDAKFVSLTRFAQTFGAWSSKESGKSKTGIQDEEIASRLRSMGRMRLGWGPWGLQQRFEEVGFDGLSDDEKCRLIRSWRQSVYR